MKEQRADPNLTVIIKLIESGQLQKRKQHGKDTPEVKSLLRIRKSLKLVKDILYRKTYTDNSSSKKVQWQLVVPKAYRSRALVGCHDDVGHQGRMRTLSLLRERFFLARHANRSYAACSAMHQMLEKEDSFSCGSFTASTCNTTIRVGPYGLLIP